MHIKEIRDLCLYKPLSDTLASLIGDKMGLHLNLTGWVSTERNWHQDDYLNPDFINSWYCAVWIALDTIHPDCGPFQYVPGSHRWPLTRMQRVHAYLQPEEAKLVEWPKIAERFVNRAFDREIARVGLPVREFLGEKGDVLVWHGRLAHRGSEPRNRSLVRKSLIAHYSALSKRTDMPQVAYTDEGAPYFVLEGYPLDWQSESAKKMSAMGTAPV
jgi:ectoine hydroxylase-related dioxygenase (phytanoyl-CoA dioxygenase family)